MAARYQRAVIRAAGALTPPTGQEELINMKNEHNQMYDLVNGLASMWVSVNKGF